MQHSYKKKRIHKEWTLVLGRFQCLPPHEGHVKLIQKLLDEGKNVIIGLRMADLTDKNPYKWQERDDAFKDIFAREIVRNRVKIIWLPDINEIAYGRTPGWKIREVKLDAETEKISATEKRNEAAIQNN